MVLGRFKFLGGRVLNTPPRGTISTKKATFLERWLFSCLEILRLQCFQGLVEASPDILEPVCGVGVVGHLEGAGETLLKERHGGGASGELFVELEGALVLECGGEDLVVEGVDGASVVSGIDIEGVSSPEAMAGGGVQPRDKLLLLNGVLREPEVLSPVEEALAAGGVEERTEGAVAPGGHAEKSVGHAVVPVAAVIDPARLEGEVREVLQMRIDGNGAVGDALADELRVGERVVDWELVVG